MPKDDKKIPTASPVSTANPNSKNGVDLSIDANVLPEGFDVGEFQKTGGLTPLWTPAAAFENKWPNVIGFMKGIEELPPSKKNGFAALCLRIKVIAPTKALQGIGDDAEIVDIAKGGDILVTIGGSLKQNTKVLAAAADPDNYYLVQIACVGQVKTGKPSPMNDIDARLHPKPSKRAGTEFAIMTAPARALLQQTGTGEVFDPSTGEVVSNGGAKPVASAQA